MSSGRGYSLVDDGIDQAAGLEVGADLGQVAPQPGADKVHVGKAAQGMAVVESHLDDGRAGAGIWIQNGVKTRRGADVRDDDLEVLLRDYLAHDIFDLTNQLIGQFQTSARRRLDTNDELAGIGAGKVSLADEGIQAQTENENAADAKDEGDRPQQADF